MTPTRRTANRTPHIAEDLRRIISAYAARRDPGTAVLLCEPRAFEDHFYPLNGRPEWSGNNGKVCYPTRDAAQRAAAAINALPGANPVRVYPCPRGGHFHHVDERRASRTTARLFATIAAAARRAAQ